MACDRWRHRLPDWIRLVRLEPPGRGPCFAEAWRYPLAEQVAQRVNELSRRLDPTPPYALFGHGPAGLLAIELAHAMRRRGLDELLALFVAGGGHGGSGYCRAWDGDRLGAALHVFAAREERLGQALWLGRLGEAGREFSLGLLDGPQVFTRERETQLLRHLRRYARQHLLRWRQDRARRGMRAAS